jgi:hypothetical protein
VSRARRTLSTAGSLAGLGLALALAACAPARAPLPASPVPGGNGITVTAKAIPLNPKDAAQDRIGDFAYAGGLELSAADTARFHGLSDLLISPKGEFTAISDEGDLLTAHLVLDRQGRPTGLSDARLTVLTGENGQPLQDKQEADAESLAVLPDGTRLVGFERRHRILAYPGKGGAPKPAPSPAFNFAPNGGMEALDADPAAGPDAYVTAAEDTGETWTCRLSGACTPGAKIAKAPEFGVVATRSLPEGRRAWLLRAWDPLRGSRIVLTIQDAKGEVARMEMAAPLSVDNFEGLAVVPGKGGAVRLYILSDDNFQSLQRTLLLAFDWKPQP